MKIIQVATGELRIPVDKGGGMEETIIGISKHLVAAGHNVTILDRKYSPIDPEVEYIDGTRIVRLTARRVSWFNFTVNFVLNQISFAYEVRKYLLRTDFDTIQTHQSVVGLFLAMTSPNLRDRLFYLSQTPRRVKQSLNLLDKIALVLENQLVKRTRKTIVQNEIAKGKLVKAARRKPEDIVLIPTGTDTDKFNPNLDVGDVRQKYGLVGKIVILFVGRIRVDKGVEYLVRAANLVVNEFGCKGVQFLLVGPTEEFGSKEGTHSPYLVKVLRLIETYGLQEDVKLTGALPLDDVRRLYTACNIFVLPSLAEAMPTAPLEAMASGKPVIATKVGGIPMEVRNGRSGFLVNQEDESQLAEKIKYLVEHPARAKEMGAFGRKIAEEEFDWSKIAERLLQVYQSE